MGGRILKAKSHARWLFVDAYLGWATLAVLASSVASATWCAEPGIRWTSGVLQLVGVVCVLRQLRGAQRLFGTADMKRAMASWWAARPKDTEIHVASGQMMTNFGQAAAASSASVTASLSTTQRLDELEKRLTASEIFARELQQGISKSHGELVGALEAERNERQRALSEQREVLGRFAVGDAWLALFGSMSILLGILLATIATELQCWNRSGAVCTSTHSP